MSIIKEGHLVKFNVFNKNTNNIKNFNLNSILKIYSNYMLPKGGGVKIKLN
jgi:hypothetical protein